MSDRPPLYTDEDVRNWDNGARPVHPSHRRYFDLRYVLGAEIQSGDTININPPGERPEWMMVLKRGTDDNREWLSMAGTLNGATGIKVKFADDRLVPIMVEVWQ